MKAIHPAPLLRYTLMADAAVSGAVAALQLLAPHWLAGLLALPAALLTASGAFLALYVLLLVLMARSKAIWTALVVLVVVGNVDWALGCAALLATDWVAPNLLGAGYLVLQALAVLVFAGLTFAGWKASAPAAALRPARA